VQGAFHFLRVSPWMAKKMQRLASSLQEGAIVCWQGTFRTALTFSFVTFLLLALLKCVFNLAHEGFAVVATKEK
jgi:hypothetical protein